MKINVELNGAEALIALDALRVYADILENDTDKMLTENVIRIIRQAVKESYSQSSPTRKRLESNT